VIELWISKKGEGFKLRKAGGPRRGGGGIKSVLGGETKKVGGRKLGGRLESGKNNMNWVQGLREAIPLR